MIEDQCTIHRSMPEWRNWQTRQLEGLVRIYAGAGSSPVSGNSSGETFQVLRTRDALFLRRTRGRVFRCRRSIRLREPRFVTLHRAAGEQATSPA